EVPALLRLTGLRPAELVPQALTRDRTHLTGLHQSVHTLRVRRGRRVVPVDTNPVTLNPPAGREPPRQRGSPTERHARLLVLTLDALHELRLIGTDRALSRRVRRQQSEVAAREPRHRRCLLPVD